MSSAAQRPKHAPPLPALMGTYQARLAAGWQPDAPQTHAVQRLQALSSALMQPLQQVPRGLWLFGPPGRGKSQLLDMFIDDLPIATKRRVHFHRFMAELHHRMNAMPLKAGTDYVAHLAEDLHAEASVLGFDEFYLTNLPDAMLLGRLMQHLFRLGTVVVATSNFAQDELFQGGLHRDRFLPLLKLIKTHLEPIDLRHGRDYRLPPAATSLPHYVHTQSGESDEAHLSVLYEDYANGPTLSPAQHVHAKRQQGKALWLTFAEACERPLGRQEYHDLASQFSTLVLEGIPRFGPTDTDAALRLITLVDIWYEQKRRLIVSAAAPAAALCPVGPAAELFRRTASRLTELTAHRGL